jgi:hypothetical protein
MITHACTSSVNPVIWSEVMEYLRLYWKRSPYESRVANPNIQMIKSPKLYNVAFNLKRKIPMAIALNTAKLLGTANIKGKMIQLNEAVQ